MLNQGNWQTIFTATNQSDSLTIPLINPVESLLIIYSPLFLLPLASCLLPVLISSLYSTDLVYRSSVTLGKCNPYNPYSAIVSSIGLSLAISTRK
jgi:hypothetical protein